MPRIASVQSNVVFNDPDANARFAIDELQRLAGQGVDLAIFPEAFLTGYCVSSREAALDVAIPRSHPSLARIRAEVDACGVMAIVGFAERDGETLYNSAALFEPGVEPRWYRKTHLPELGFDKFAKPGDSLEVFETKIGRIGLLICFDSRHPEATKTLALKGADLVCLPTNWPEGANITADVICVSRAAENRVFFATCDRVGEENGFRFIGKSKIIGVTGAILASAGSEAETIVADVDFAEARNKRTVTIPGAYETTLDISRRPELYGAITDKGR